MLVGQLPGDMMALANVLNQAETGLFLGLRNLV
jgi:hypothetical protein